MTTALDKPKKVIVMRKAGEIWVAEEKATKLEAMLAGSQGHRFVQIEGQTINTADIEGIYTAEQIAEKHRAAAGETKCVYGNWHAKREKCDCLREINRRAQQDRQDATMREMTREITPAEKEKNLGRMKSMREILEAKGVLPKKV